MSAKVNFKYNLNNNFKMYSDLDLSHGATTLYALRQISWYI